MALSKTWLSLKHLLSHILHSHSSARLQAHTEALWGWREAASSVKHPGKQKECSTLLLPSRELISLHMSHFTYSKKWKHATTPSKWSQSTLQGICFHFKGRDQNPQRGEGGEKKERKKERCSQPVHEINVGPNLRSFHRGRERYRQKNHRALSVAGYLCAGGLILHQINGRFATNFNGSRNSSYHLEVYWLSAESSKFYTEIKQRIIWQFNGDVAVFTLKETQIYPWGFAIIFSCLLVFLKKNSHVSREDW